MKYILGLDIGTGEVKSCLFDLERRVIAKNSIGLSFQRSQEGFFEQDPNNWLKSVKEAIVGCLTQASVSQEKIIGLGVTATSATVIFCDKDGEPLFPAIMWMDARSFREAEEITKTRDESLRFVGGREPAEYFWPKVFWMQKKYPNLFGKAIKIVDAVDWIIFQLTGNWGFSYTNAVVKAHYYQGLWPNFVPSDFIKRLPKVVSLTEVRGGLSFKRARILGLKINLPVVSAGIDGYAAMVGVGLQENEIGVSMGTSWSQFLVSSKEGFREGVWGPFYGVILPEKYVYEAGQVIPGQLIRDFMGYFGIYDLRQLDEEASHVSKFPILGIEWKNRWPERIDFRKVAAFYPSFSQAAIFRGILEEVISGCVINIGNLLKVVKDKKAVKIRVCGGGAKSDLWCKLLEKRTGLPIIKLEEEIGATKGAAIYTALALGEFSSIAQAQKVMVK